MTTLIQSVSEWQTIRSHLAKDKPSIGFVPTMGNLHAGHESLLKRAKLENTVTVLSLFTNPTQFDDPNDFNHYPQTLANDLAMATDIGIDWVLAPKADDLYPDNYRYRVIETELSHLLCGKYREGHFTGVLTIVLKLFLLVKPTYAYFGEKDFQQLELINGMVEAFFLDTHIVACPTIRDANGLALSSRNQRLSASEHELAISFPKLLHSSLSNEEITAQLTALGFVVDYIETREDRRFGAVWLGEVRLIDNVEFT